MANSAIKWVAGATTLTAVLSTEMNSQANNALPSALGTAFDNSSNKDQFFDIEVHLASLTPTAGGYVAVYAALAVDGSNYGDMKREMMQQLIGIIYLDTATAAKHSSLRLIQLPPRLMKFYLDNQTGVSLASSGNTIKIIGYNLEIQVA